MALRSAPPRELQLDAIYSDNEGPGIRAYVFGRLAKGDSVQLIVDRFAQEHTITVPAPTLYEWLRRWRREQSQQSARRLPRVRRQAPTEATEPEGAAA